jgi:hypothetical protein
MLSEKLLTSDQQGAIDFLYDHNASILIADTGEGKTVICQTTINELIKDRFLKGVIVACPARVVGVWPKEAKKWDHLKGLRVIAITGDAKQRLALLEQSKQDMAHVLVISLNNLKWLLAQDHACDGIIIDELSKAAGKQAAGLKTKKFGGCFKWRVGMTATPVAHDFIKLYGMVRIIAGKSSPLGTNKQAYENNYFNSDYQGYNLTLREGADKVIMSKIAPLVHLIDSTKSQTLPPWYMHDIRFDMPDATREIYDEMKETMVVEGLDLEAANQAVVSGKLRQVASGFIYREETTPAWLDGARCHLSGQWAGSLVNRKGIIFYEYEAQFVKISNAMGHHMANSVEAFINGPHQLLVAQINSLSHGVDGLQDVCHDALFYHPFWSADACTQAIGRLWRTGQKHPVNISRLICNDTLDDVCVARVEGRAEWMELFVKHMKEGGE